MKEIDICFDVAFIIGGKRARLDDVFDVLMAGRRFYWNEHGYR